MGRRKGSKNKKTLMKLGKLSSKATTIINGMHNQGLEFRLDILEKVIGNLNLTATQQGFACLSNKLETLSDTLCKLFQKVDAIENTLSPLMFVERTDKGVTHEKESESSSEERQQEN